MSLSKLWKGAEERPKPAVPDGRRVYAIGDIHGRADLLDELAGLIARDLAARPVPQATTIFLGDYVDRGPRSNEVIDRLVRGDFPTPIVTLRGNHEDVMVGFLMGEVDGRYHAQLGGEATLRSYGIDLSSFARSDATRREAMLHAAIPDAHCRFLDTLRLCATIGGYFFCHAGVRPGVPLDRQSPEDLLWIREEFLRSTVDFGRIVVHGHTPVPEPHVRVNGINVDTQAYATGILTAAVLEGTDIRFLRTG